MVTTLTGNNSFLVTAEQNRLVQDFIMQHGDMAVQKIDGEDTGYDQIREALESLPFLASKKLVVLRSPSANKEFIAKAEQLINNLSDATDVIIYEPKPDKRSVYYKFLKKNTEYKELNEPDEESLVRWLIQEAQQRGGSLGLQDARYLTDRIGLNQQLLSSELNKLLTYRLDVNRETINLLTEPTPQSTVFQLLDVAFSGNSKKVLAIYQQLRATKTEPLAIIGMLAWQLHVSAIILAAGDRSDSTIASEAKVNPFVIRKSRQIAKRLSLTRVKQLISQLLETDINLKSTATDADDALQDFLLHI